MIFRKVYCQEQLMSWNLHKTILFSRNFEHQVPHCGEEAAGAHGPSFAANRLSVVGLGLAETLNSPSMFVVGV